MCSEKDAIPYKIINPPPGSDLSKRTAFLLIPQTSSNKFQHSTLEQSAKSTDLITAK